MNLRERKKHPSFFIPTHMSYTRLPTFIDVYNNILFVKTSNKKNEKNTAIDNTTKRIVDIWYNASLPVKSVNTIKTKITNYIKVVDNLLKSSKHNYFKKYSLAHYNKYNKLFDICKCQCSVFITCKYVNECRIPPAELEFLIDQRTNRLRNIITINSVTTFQSRTNQPSTSQDTTSNPLL